MKFAWLIPSLLGIAGVIQTTLNRSMGGQIGFPTAVLINSLMVLAFTAMLLASAQSLPAAIGKALPLDEAWKNFQWWWLVPGFCGFAIILGMSYSLTVLSASQAFTIFIVAQIVAGVLYDFFKQPEQITPWTYVGVALAVIGSLLVAIKPQQ